jgi:hypothetical protein
MAAFDVYKPTIGTKDYLTRYDAFIDEMQAYAVDVDAARDGELTILANLTANYIGYTLGADIDGLVTYKCINMPSGVDAQDYITVSQANSIAASGGVTSIVDISVGTLQANDILVVEPGGGFITGRSTKYTNHIATSVANGNYNMNLENGGTQVTALPAGIDGTVISFADLSGSANATDNFTITANGTDKIMGVTTDPLVINDYPYCSFDLVYTGAAFGWTLARFQR